VKWKCQHQPLGNCRFVPCSTNAYRAKAADTQRKAFWHFPEQTRGQERKDAVKPRLMTGLRRDDSAKESLRRASIQEVSSQVVLSY
jgi:hypothetical protein